jgi:Sigma-54 interaction domain
MRRGCKPPWRKTIDDPWQRSLPLPSSLMTSWRARFTFDDIRGGSDALARVIRTGRRAAEGGYPTLIIGESGTGKELLAHGIHNASPLRDGPFVAVNCGTLTGELAVAELCGYEPGAFTGADRRTHTGILDVARGGTLLLDELQDMPPTAQSALLRFLETGSFVRVGGTQLVQASVRAIATLNVGVDELERRGLVRADLLYRLNCVTIEVPPLRERREDIRPIAEKCLREELHFLGDVEESFWDAVQTCPRLAGQRPRRAQRPPESDPGVDGAPARRVGSAGVPVDGDAAAGARAPRPRDPWSGRRRCDRAARGPAGEPRQRLGGGSQPRHPPLDGLPPPGSRGRLTVRSGRSRPSGRIPPRRRRATGC